MIRNVSNINSISFGIRANLPRIAVESSIPHVGAEKLIGHEVEKEILNLEEQYHVREIRGLEEKLKRLEDQSDKEPDHGLDYFKKAIEKTNKLLREARERFDNFKKGD